MYLADRVPLDNLLLDDLEFSDSEIDAAMDLMAARYNTIPPFVSNETKESFPFMYEGTIGTSYFLLKSKSINMMRNNLNYQAADGVAINDLERRKEYMAIADAMYQEFVDNCRRIKLSINAESCYGYV